MAKLFGAPRQLIIDRQRHGIGPDGRRSDIQKPLAVSLPAKKRVSSHSQGVPLPLTSRDKEILEKSEIIAALQILSEEIRNKLTGYIKRVRDAEIPMAREVAHQQIHWLLQTEEVRMASSLQQLEETTTPIDVSRGILEEKTQEVIVEEDSNRLLTDEERETFIGLLSFLPQKHLDTEFEGMQYWSRRTRWMVYCGEKTSDRSLRLEITGGGNVTEYRNKEFVSLTRNPTLSDLQLVQRVIQAFGVLENSVLVQDSIAQASETAAEKQNRVLTPEELKQVVAMLSDIKEERSLPDGKMRWKGDAMERWVQWENNEGKPCILYFFENSQGMRVVEGVGGQMIPQKPMQLRHLHALQKVHAALAERSPETGVEDPNQIVDTIITSKTSVEWAEERRIEMAKWFAENSHRIGWCKARHPEEESVRILFVSRGFAYFNASHIYAVQSDGRIRFYADKANQWHLPVANDLAFVKKFVFEEDSVAQNQELSAQPQETATEDMNRELTFDEQGVVRAWMRRAPSFVPQRLGAFCEKQENGVRFQKGDKSILVTNEKFWKLTLKDFEFIKSVAVACWGESALANMEKSAQPPETAAEDSNRILNQEERDEVSKIFSRIRGRKSSPDGKFCWSNVYDTWIQWRRDDEVQRSIHFYYNNPQEGISVVEGVGMDTFAGQPMKLRHLESLRMVCDALAKT